MRCSTIILFLLFTTSAFLAAQPQLQEGFQIQTVSEGWGQLTGLEFGEDGTLYILDKRGIIWLVKEGKKLDTPFLDIQDEVANHGDMGLMGFELDPDFRENGYCYVFYLSDYNNVINEGKPDFDPKASLLWRSTIARVARFQANLTDFSTVDPSTRHLLVGATKESGIPVLHESHIGGGLAIGTDGTLIIATGDASTWKGAYVGGGPPYFEERAQQALDENIIRPAEEVGSFRSQLINNLNGKILRVDRATGEGIPSNPFYDAANPNAPCSKVWSLGLRNPFTIAIRPNSGSSNPANALPGSIYIGDVGEGRWEELNIARLPRENFGWPHFEGMHRIYEYNNQIRANLDIPNPLFGQIGCDQTHFNFQDLIRQPSPGPVLFQNPCDTTQSIPDSLRFIHHPPDLAIAHVSIGDGFYTPAFDENGEIIRLKTNEPNSPVIADGRGVTANASIAIGFYEGKTFPENYQGKFFLADHTKGWIKAVEVDLNDQIISVEDFFRDTIFIPHAAFHPIDGSLYFIDFKHRSLKRISYGENVPPIAIATADVYYGPSPLAVQFNGNQSSDPQQDSILYLWDFGDGTISTLPNPSHLFEAADNQPKSFTVSLTITDEWGASTQRELLISLNNTPPTVQISNIQNGDFYPLSSTTSYPLQAQVSDAEHAKQELQYEWQTTLNHNNHNHPEPVDTQRITRTLIVPAGCDGEIYSYDISLTVTDAAGLSGRDVVRLFPDCTTNFVHLSDFEIARHPEGIQNDWTTLSEFNLDFFEVERKGVSETEFQTIATVSPQNIHNIATNYQYLDTAPLSGFNTYRIKMVSKEGTIVYSVEKRLFFVNRGELTYSPNPTNGQLSFFLQPSADHLQLSLYSSNGQLLKMQEWSTDNSIQFQLDLDNLLGGTYLFTIQDGEEWYSGKILKY